MRTVSLLLLMVLGLGVGVVRGQEPAAPLVVPEVQDQSAPETPACQDPWVLGNAAPDGRTWAEADYVLYWLKPVCFTVPGISAGSQSSVLGQPGANLLEGDNKFQFGGASGLRSRLGAWLTDDQLFGVEAEGFVLEQVAAGQTVTGNSSTAPTFLVFQNPDNSNGALPFSIPGVVNAVSSAVGTSRWWDLEASLDTHFSTTRGPWLFQSTWLAGIRYLELDDGVVITNHQSLVADPAVAAMGQDNFATRNQFTGGQVGSRFSVGRGPLALDMTAKLAVGGMYLVSTVAGSPLLSGASVLPPLVPGPIQALPSNVGQLASDRIAVIPEFNLRLRWQVCNHVQLTLGYNVLYVSKILCPGDQMSPYLNTTELPYRGPAAGPAEPGPKFVFTDAFAQGLEAGLCFSF
jgi:hypothetical protein